MSDASQLEAYRNHMDVSQAVMARHMGVPLRTYEDLAAGRSTVRPIHLNAARYACLTITIEQSEDLLFLPFELRDVVHQIKMPDECEAITEARLAHYQHPSPSVPQTIVPDDVPGEPAKS